MAIFMPEADVDVVVVVVKDLVTTVPAMIKVRKVIPVAVVAVAVNPA
jgi:hypothetical protein